MPDETSDQLTISPAQSTKLTISGANRWLVEIDMRDGSMRFSEDYTPDGAAKSFWQAISQEHRDMLKWKADLARPTPRAKTARSLEDRLAEALRRLHRGLVLPLWCDLEEHHKQVWRGDVKPFLTILESVGVKVEIDGR